MKHLIGKNVLLTTNWFYAPDGKQYNAVYGFLYAIKEAKESLGFAPHRSHANWVLNIGNMTITGCQVNYAIECDTCETSIGFSLVCDKDTKEGLFFGRKSHYRV
jgi:hypothetical protein